MRRYQILLTFSMSSEIFINISKIIEQESKTSTYKFALLRGTIDLIQENSPYIVANKDRVYIPMGLLINKWIFYYYPLLESSVNIPQINGHKPIAFEKELKSLINDYRKKGDISVLYNDLRTSNLDKASEKLLIDLYAKLQRTISSMPMKYLGTSINKVHNSIFEYHGHRKANQNKLDFVQGYGTFSIPSKYYDALRILGSFINGQESIINKWAEFSWNCIGNNVKNKSVIIGKLLDNPVTERQVNESKLIFRKIQKEVGSIECVWTGKNVRNSDNYDLDHLLPFSVWRNNDMWNLLPTTSTVNKQKSNLIPSPERIERARATIVKYWQILQKINENRFNREIEQALLGITISNGWEQLGIKRIKEHSEYLIKYRGYEHW